MTFRKKGLNMRIEISNYSKTNLTKNERDTIYELVNKCTIANYLISEENNGALVVIECVSEACTAEITKHLSNEYKITVTEDSFMAQIDLMDLLSGGFW